MFTIGLTGGIASGKSTVAALLRDRGAAVINVDRLAHETYAPGTPGFSAVRAAFGEGVVSADGSIDRQALGRIVFANSTERRRLTDIVWPRLRERLQQEIAERKDETGVVVFEAAVLFEAGWEDLFDAVWLVAVPQGAARERLVGRDGLTPAEADARIAALLPDEGKAEQSDVVNDNSGSLEALEAQVDRAWARLFAHA